MHHAHHHMSELFKQLGLPNTDAQIQEFLSAHRPLPAKRIIADAEFWTDSQASFLREALAQDSDWSVIVDQLSQALRSAGT
ncbi:DUF2789 family protein [Paraperlucidibaca wandonensis]|jgi:hypothetical protein|uniref:DUF2789 family protein n=1 Tax=Paraperlucidibaca wandonensis TaxID=1268273 RepID=A0ABW3HCY7_9GAMM|nr:DUF2789 domain-containing protein [Paraperlucidibaca sp.]MBQ0841383.1 DUF2789 domain-containing protein [Paraperlucidibaca sp.]|tara:strand:+ start:73 stop:315 length:243 start_codon:yes stop_codon:yes gene_type:complete